MYVGSGQFATVEVNDTGNTIQFKAKGHNIEAEEDVTITYISPVIIISDAGYLVNNEREQGLKSWGGVLIAIAMILLLMIAGIGYYLGRGRSLKSELTRKPDNTAFLSGYSNI